MSRKFGEKTHRWDQRQFDKNMAALPSNCFGTLNTDGSLILMKAGEKGYWPARDYPLSATVDSYDKLADLLNARRNITRAQRLAMEAASMFGFDLPIGHPSAHADRAMQVVGLDPLEGTGDGGPHEARLLDQRASGLA